jgi:hypothetical protein
MASIFITNVSVNFTNDTFQGKVDFDLECSPTEARLNVGFKISLDTQLNFDAIDYGSNELIEWCKKQFSDYDKYDHLLALSSDVVMEIKAHIDDYDISADAILYLQRERYFQFDELLEKLMPVNFYKALVRTWYFTDQEKAQFFNMIVAYPEQQTSSSHSVEFSVPKESLLNWRLEGMENEIRDEFLALAGHQLDVWLSAEPDLGNANTQGRFEYSM